MCRALYARSCIMCILYCILFFGICIIIIIMCRKKNLFAHCVLCIIIFGMWMIIIKMCREKMYIYMPIAFCEML